MSPFNPAFNKEPWIPLKPAVISKPGERALKDYLAVMRQFDVLTNPRYMAFHRITYCNIFVWDCTSALGCEIPHWYNDAGETTPVGKGHEMTANKMFDWLKAYGPAHGWMECQDFEAQAWAAQAFPTIAIYQNPHGIGHVAMVMAEGENLHIAQAGASNLWNAPLARGFGKLPVVFFTHQ